MPLLMSRSVFRLGLAACGEFRPPLRSSFGYSDLPQVRAAGDGPGKAAFQDLSKFFNVITLLALLSALVLISNTS